MEKARFIPLSGCLFSDLFQLYRWPSACHSLKPKRNMAKGYLPQIHLPVQWVTKEPFETQRKIAGYLLYSWDPLVPYGLAWDLGLPRIGLPISNFGGVGINRISLAASTPTAQTTADVFRTRLVLARKHWKRRRRTQTCHLPLEHRIHIFWSSPGVSMTLKKWLVITCHYPKYFGVVGPFLRSWRL